MKHAGELSPTRLGPARQAFIGLGSNLGDRAAMLRGAVARLGRCDGVAVVAASAVYETEPVSVTDQPSFLNQVVAIETTLAPEQLLDALQAIEAEFGRVRDVRWGPRTLDLDLLAYEGEARDTERLVLPHPRMFERAFVLVPLRELLAQPRLSSPAWQGLRAKVEAAKVPSTGVRQCEG